MHTVTPKKDKSRKSGKLNLAAARATGHVPHRGGAGQHAHRGTARNRTRSQQRANALRGD